MPIYEYRCIQCEYRLEKLQKMNDIPLKECPNCHQSSLKKLISAAAFKLKGKGWYETDFKKSNDKKIEQPKTSTQKNDVKKVPPSDTKKTSSVND
jgi:putative FmdB family regulatory protein